MSASAYVVIDPPVVVDPKYKTKIPNEQLFKPDYIYTTCPRRPNPSTRPQNAH